MNRTKPHVIPIRVQAERSSGSQKPAFHPQDIQANPGDILQFFCEDEPLTFWVYDCYENCSPCLFGGNYTGYCATPAGTKLEILARRGTIYMISLVRPERRGQDTSHHAQEGDAILHIRPVQDHTIALKAAYGPKDGTIHVG